MGCCTSSANEIQTIIQVNKQQTIQQTAKVYPIEPQIQSQQQDENEVTQHQVKESKVTKKPPCKHPRPQNYEDLEQPEISIQQKITKPKIKTKLQMLIEFGRELKQNQHVNSDKENSLVDQIETQIFDGSISIDYLNELSKDNSVSIIQLLFLKGCQQITMLEMILIYIENYDIITHLLLECELPIGDDLFYIIRRLIKKLRPQRNKQQQCLQSIKFLKQISTSSQVQQLIQKNCNGHLFKELTDFQESFDLTNSLHIKVLGRISKLLSSFNIQTTIADIYIQAQTNLNFLNFRIPHKVPEGQSDYCNNRKIYLNELNMNVFHWLTLNNKWDIIIKYSNPLFQQKDCTKMTPFLIMLQKAPIEFIINYLQKYPSQIEASITNSNQKMNLLHSFCMNKHLSKTDENSLMLIIEILSQFNISKIILEPFHDQIPLVVYLDCQNVILNEFVTFLSQGVVKEFDFFTSNAKMTQIAEQEKNAKKNKFLFKDYKFCKHLLTLQSLNKKQQKYLNSHPIDNTYEQEEILYLHYIQLLKQVIRRDFSIKFDWLNNFNIYTSFAPYDLGTSNQTFIQILLRKGYHEQAKATIIQMKEELIQKTINNQIIQLQDYSFIGQFLAKLISLKKELKSNPYEQVIQLIDSTVIEFIQQNSRLLIQPIYGTSEFKQIQYETLYSLLLQVKDEKLFDECLGAQLLFPLNNETKRHILFGAFELNHLNSKDHLLKKILDDIPYKGIIKFYQKKQMDIGIVNPKKAEKEQSYFYVQTLLNIRPIFAKKQNIIEALLSDDQDKYELLNFSAYISASTIRAFQLNPESQQHFTDMVKEEWFCKTAKFRPLSLSKFWFYAESDYFSKIAKFLTKNFKFKIQRLQSYEFEKLYNIQHLGFTVQIINVNFDSERVQSSKEEVIEWQLKNGSTFWQALSICNDRLQDLQSYLLNSTEIVQQIQSNQILLVEAIKRNIIENSLLICKEKGFTLEDLIDALFFQVFGSNSKTIQIVSFNQNKDQIQLFDQYLNKLLQSQYNIFKNDTENYSMISIMPYISNQNWILLNQTIQNQILKSSQGQVNLIKSIILFQDYNSEKQATLKKYLQSNIQIDVLTEFLDKLISLLIKMSKIDQEIFKFLLNLIKNQELNEKTQNSISKLYYNFFKQQENLAINYLNELKLTQNQVRSLYSMALKRISKINLYKILHYCETQNIQLDNQVIMVPQNCQYEIENFYRAMQHPYYLIFNQDQYKQFLDQTKLTEQQTINHINQFLLHGMYDKLKLIFTKNAVLFESYCQSFFKISKIYLEKQFSITLQYSGFEGNQDENNSEGKLQLIHFFSSQKLSTLQSTQEANLQTINQQVNKLNLQSSLQQFRTQKKLVQLKQKIKHLESNEKHVQDANKNQRRNPIFICSGNQQIDYIKCFELIVQSVKIDQLKKKRDLFVEFEFYKNLLFPDGKIVEKKQEMLHTLFQVYEKNRFPNEFLKQRNKQYLQLANAILNQKKFKIDFDTSIPNQMTLFQKEFFVEIMLCNQDQAPEEIANQILHHNIQDKRCVKYLQTNLKGMNQYLFNATTQYYFQNKVDLLQKDSTIDTSSLYGWSVRQELVKKILKLNNQFNIDQISNEQIFLYKGKFDYVKKPFKYSIENLVISLIGNHFQTILFVLNSAKSNNIQDLKLNVFKILLLQQCEKNIIQFFDSNLKNELKDVTILYDINNTPTLYFLLYQKKQQIVQQILISSLLKQLGSQKGIDFIKTQLALPTKLTEYKVYQIALMNKAYYLLDYLDDIIQLDDLTLITSPLSISQEQINLNQVDKKSAIFYQNYFSNAQECLKLIFWPHRQKKVKKSKRSSSISKKLEFQKQSLYIRDKILAEIIKVEQACLNNIFNLGQDINFKSKLLDLKFAKYKWNKLSLYHYSNEYQKLTIDQLEQQGTKFEEFMSFFSQQLTKQVIHQSILDYFEKNNFDKILKFIIPLHVTLELIIMCYTKLNKEQFQKFAMKQTNSFKRDQYEDQEHQEEEGFQEQYEYEEEEQSYKIYENEYLTNQSAYFLIFLQSFQNDQFGDEFLKKYKISAIYLQKARDMLSQKIKEKQQISLTKNAKDFIFNISSSSFQIQNQEIFIQELLKEKSSEIALIQGLFLIKNVEWIIECIQKLLKQFFKKVEHFCVYFELQEQDIELSSNKINIYLTLQNNQIVFDQAKLQKLKEVLEKSKVQTQLSRQKHFYQQFQEQNLIPSQYDFSSITLVSFEHLNFKNCFNQFLALVKQQNKYGIYEIDDFFAPHQNDQQQQPQQELEQEMSLQRAPSLRRQSSSQMGPIGMQRSQSINNRQRLKEDFQFMLELLPDNTYQVRQRRTNHYQREIIFPEFYNFQSPKILVNFIKTDIEQFNNKYSNQSCLSNNISDLYKYSEFLREQMQGNLQNEPWLIDFPFYIQNQEVKFKQCLFSTQFIQTTHKILLDFIENVKEYAKNENLSKLEWRVNAISVLEVFVSKIIEISNSDVDIYEALNYICNWKSLIMILNTLIYKNLSDAHQVLKVIKGIYIEFNENKDINKQNCQVLDTNDKLDQLFIFGKTTYFLQNHILIIRINVVSNTEKNIMIIKRTNNLIPDPNVQFYYNAVLTIFDFYTQIFSSEQLIQLIFNKIEVDRELLKISDIISRKFGRTITLTVDHQSLISAFTSEMIRASQNQDLRKKHQCYEEIWSILKKLRQYFMTDVQAYILSQFSAEKIGEIFSIRLNSLLISFKYHKRVNEILESNIRQLSNLSGDLVVEKICNLKIETPILFGFQFQAKIYVNFSKLGDIIGVCYYHDSKIHFQLGQLIYNSKKGQLLLLNLNLQQHKIQTQQQILKNQPTYQMVQATNKFYTVCNIEDMNSILLFQPQWPVDQNQNDAILNLFFVDSDANLYHCLEKNFLNQMKLIQKEDSEHKQQLFDEIFDYGQVSAFGELTLTSMIPIFQDVINFDFLAVNTLKKQLSATSNSVFVRLSDDQFTVDPLVFPQVCIASHFETNQKGQKLIQEISKFVSNHKELNEVFLTFDDELNNNASLNSQKIISKCQIFQSFQKGYESFLLDEAYPKLFNSMQQIMDISSFKQIKCKIIQLLIKKVEIKFIYKFSYEENDLGQYPLITLENNQLNVISYITDFQIIEPDYKMISEYLQRVLIKYHEIYLPQLIDNEGIVFKIEWQNIPEKQFLKQFTDIIILCQVLFKLINMISPDQCFKIIKILSTQEIQQQVNYYQYFYNNNVELVINYIRLQDFSLFEFLIDFMNDKCPCSTVKETKKIQYVGPDILIKTQQIDPFILFSGLDEKQNIQLLLKMDNSQIEEMKSINPDQFNQSIVFLKINSLFVSINLIKSYKHPLLNSYDNKENNFRLVGKQQGILIKQMDKFTSLESQLARIKVRIRSSSTYKKVSTLDKFVLDKIEPSIQMETKFLSENYLLLLINSDLRIKIEFYSKSYQFSVSSYSFTQKLQTRFDIQTTIDLSATKHLSIQYKGKSIPIQLEKEEHSAYGKGNWKLIKLIMKEARQNEEYLYLQQNIESINHSKELQAGNIITVLSNQDFKASTRAGEVRIDYLEFKDSDGNTVLDFTVKSIFYIHSLFNQIQYIPEISRFEEGINLKWSPTFKGIYNLYIDNVKIQGRFIILAAIPNIDQTILEMQENLETIPFFENIQLTCYLKDIFYNSFGETENQIYDQAQCLIKIAKTEKQSSLKVEQSQLSKIGQINFKVLLAPYDVSVLEDEIILDVLINNQLKRSLFFKVSGLGLEKRQQKFQEDVKQVWKPKSYSLSVKRIAFLQDLLELANEQMNFSFSIKFVNEPGIDAGGLKREFYDMIGNTLKDEKYKYFQPTQSNQSKYFLHPKFNKNKNKEIHALLFGKLIANAICNQYIIGIDIIEPFWKVVYGLDIAFQDLKLILDQDTYKNYENLRNLTPSELDSACLDFTYFSNNTMIELIPGGASKNVDKKNLEFYMKKTAEYIIHKQFAEIYKSFIAGFSSVLDLKICSKWLQPNEISLLTQGLAEITPNILLQKINFSGGKPQHKAFFETYVSQANSQLLKNMLKFITGSSSIPFDQSSYVILVQFRANLSKTKLPLSHTCFKSIEIPEYNNYAELKQKLDIAFTIGIEGYGFG